MSSSAAPPTPIEALLRVRQAAEDHATRALQAALSHRVAAEGVQRGLDQQVRLAREELSARRASVADAAEAARAAGKVTSTAAAGDQRERFWRRLREEIAQRSERALVHRQGALARACADAEAAAVAHRAARAARQQVERLCENAELARRRISARRAEVALDEQAQATALGRAAPPPSLGSRRR
jgi:flagellar biosynthesis chaperone FliJ